MGRPIKNLNVIVLEPLLCLLGGVFWIIVLLENLFILRKVQTVRATCKLRGDGDSKESEQSIKTKYNSKKLEKQGGSSNNEIKSVY